MLNCGRNSAINSSKLAKIIRNWRQNDGQSTPDNFLKWFGVNERFLTELSPFHCFFGLDESESCSP